MAYYTKQQVSDYIKDVLQRAKNSEIRVRFKDFSKNTKISKCFFKYLLPLSCICKKSLSKTWLIVLPNLCLP